jgi:site-specific DNA-methyltransferase (adenine-specific)
VGGRLGVAGCVVNKLFYGDNLTVLREHLNDEMVDLVYLDPPFNSNETYNVLFGSHGRASEAQAEAFKDTWSWEHDAAQNAYQDILDQGGRPALLIKGLRSAIGDSPMMAYVLMMAVRLIELRRVLKPTGSLYLHCDSTASHYLKIILDAIFGSEHYQSEIIWQKIRSSKAQTIGFGSVHDSIFVYQKNDNTYGKKLYTLLSDERIALHYGQTEEETGRRFGLYDFTQAGRGEPRIFGGKKLSPPHGKHWIWGQERIDEAWAEGKLVFTSSTMVRVKRYLDESRGNPMEDIWTDIPPINAMARERLGYPTQKPVALLERIIDASAPEGGMVLDPFCRCGTTIVASQKLAREWIGIDITHYAITLIERRLAKLGVSDKDYSIVGRLVHLGGAIDLARRDKHQFQWWACWFLGAQTYREEKRGADRGVDGNIFFANGPYGTGRIIISVKGG